jgi:hypothetical protein
VRSIHFLCHRNFVVVVVVAKQSSDAERACEVIAEFAATLVRASSTTTTTTTTTTEPTSLTTALTVAQEQLLKARMQRTMAHVVRVTARAICSTSLAARLAGLLVAQRLVAALANIERYRRSSSSSSAADAPSSDESATYTTEAPVQCALLPTVHDLWSTVLARLDDRRAPVVIDAVRTIDAFVVASRSFVATRFAREAWPSLVNLMQPTTTAMLGHSAEHKRAAAIVACVAAAVRHCELAHGALVAIRDTTARWSSTLRWPAADADTMSAQLQRIERDCVVQLTAPLVEPSADVL